MLHFDSIVFGPVRSRRLGVSLGINLLPTDGKLCNFDCIYCECGWNREGVAKAPFPSVEAVEEALRAKLTAMASEGVKPDSITFSGDGEPTLHPHFPEIVDVVLSLRDVLAPGAKVSVLSNATTCGKPAVAEALRRVDNPILKIDAPTSPLAGKINQPQGVYNIEDVVHNLEAFGGDFILQTMFLRSPSFDSASPEVLLPWMDIVRRLHPRQTMVYSLDRETPQKGLVKYDAETLRRLVAPLVEEGYNISINA